MTNEWERGQENKKPRRFSARGFGSDVIRELPVWYATTVTVSRKLFPARTTSYEAMATAALIAMAMMAVL
jgi:hypothetical protein